MVYNIAFMATGYSGKKVRMRIRLRYILLALTGLLVIHFFYREGIASQQGFASDNFNDSFTGSYLAGYVAGKEGNWEKAAELLEEAQKKAPDNYAVAESSYTLRLLSGDIRDAIDVAKHYEGKENGAIIPSILLSTEAICTGNYKKAQTILYNIAPPDEGDAPAVGAVIVPFLAAWSKIGQGQYDEGLNILKALENDTTHEIVQYHMALLYDLMGDSAAAQQAYEASLSGKVKPYHFVSAAGSFYIRHHMMDKAKALYHSYQKANPTTEFFDSKLALLAQGKLPQMETPTAKQGFVEALMEGVRISYQNELYTEGLAYLQMINYLEPDFPQSIILLANYYEEQKEYIKANSLYSKIAKDSDFYWKSQINIAKNLYQADNKPQGEALLRKLVNDKPTSFVAPLELADLLRDDKRYQEAAAAYEDVVSRIPNPGQFHWFIFYTQGISYEHAGQWDKAEKAFLTALDLYPNQADVLNYLGYSWLMMDKNVEKATKMIEQAIEERPDDAHIMDSMGWALFQVGHYDKAVNYLEQAVETMPYDPIMNEHLGDVYWRMGRKNEARYQWQRVIKDHDAEPEQVKGLMEKLQYGLQDHTGEQKVSTSQY